MVCILSGTRGLWCLVDRAFDARAGHALFAFVGMMGPGYEILT